MPIATDPLSLVFIACFLFGLLFFLGTILLGNVGHGHTSSHVGGHAQGGGHTGGHASSTHTAGHGSTHTSWQADVHGLQGDILSLLSYINITSIVLFLLGFGFFGYVFHNTIQLITSLTLTLAGVGGITIAVLMLFLLTRLFGDSEGATVQDVSDRTGMLGKVSITIQENSLGEIIYVSPGGMRKSIPARSIDGRRIERDQEVVVVNYQHGVAEVDTWDHFLSEETTAHNEAQTPAADDLAQLRALLEESDRTDTELIIRKDLQKE